jgi:hypothetical protein
MDTPDDRADGEGAAEGAAVFPLIPEGLPVHPLLLGMLHAVVFVDGSTEEIIDPDAAEEAMQYIVTYLHRLKGPLLQQVQEDLACLLDYAKQQGWPRQQQVFLKSFVAEFVLGSHGEPGA